MRPADGLPSTEFGQWPTLVEGHAPSRIATTDRSRTALRTTCTFAPQRNRHVRIN